MCHEEVFVRANTDPEGPEVQGTPRLVGQTEPPAAIAVLSVVIAALVSVGATFGGALVFEYGFNVETAGDHPVWHQSEDDVFPGED